MPFIEESLSGGLVTSRDPAFLEPGELQATTNAIYIPGDDGIHRYPGISTWSTVDTGGAVSGLTSCRFNNGNHYLVAQDNGNYWIADAETDLSSFATASAVTGGLQLQSAQYNNKWFLFNGVDQNKTLKDDGTMRAMGLQAVNTILGTATAASAFSLGSATGYYDYWFTEVLPLASGDELESAYNAAVPATVFVSASGSSPVLTTPTVAINAGVTKYRIYRSNAKAAAATVVYPLGTQVAEVPLGAVWTDGGTSTTDTARLPSSVDTVTSWVNEANVETANPGAETPATLTNSGLVASKQYGFLAYNFPFGALNGNITGVTVTVHGKTSTTAHSRLQVALVQRTANNTFTFNSPVSLGASYSLNGDGSFAPGTLPFLAALPSKLVTLTTSYTDVSIGSSTDTWLYPTQDWSTLNFDGTFAILLIGSFDATAVNTDVISIDSVKLAVSFAGPQANATLKAYEAISITVGSDTSISPVNMPPPVSKTGTIFEGALVTDDSTDPSKIRYSFPGKPESFPSLYFLQFETGDNDTVNYVGTVNNILVVGMSGSLWRVNYLPSEEDASFDRGRAVQLISNSYGIVRPTAACTYTSDNGQQELAFVSPNGIFSTDGYSVRDLLEDIQWIGPNGVFLALSSSIYTSIVALLNDPGTQTLRLILNNNAYTASYAPRHRKRKWGIPGTVGITGSGVKWTGPNWIRFKSGATTRSVQSATVIRRSTGVYIVVYGRSAGASGGNVVREDSADNAFTLPNTLQDDAHTTLVFKTRDMYHAQRGHQFRINDLWVYGIDYGAVSPTINPPQGTIIATQIYVNAGTDNTFTETFANTSSTKMLALGIGNVNADAVNIQFTQTSTNPSVFYSLPMDVEDGGDAKRA